MSTNLNQDGSEERPEFDFLEGFSFTQTPNPSWKPGDGSNDEEWRKHKKLAIPVSPVMRENYRFLIGGITPRPIGFVATVDKEGNPNVAPFSFFNVNLSDPPVFSFGITGEKGTLDNILDTKEMTINIISEWFLEAANFCSIDAPRGLSEFKLSGLTPAESVIVKPPHVAESAFSVEAQLIHHEQFYSAADPTKKSGSVLMVKGVYFHIREDVMNDEKTLIRMDKLRPVSRIGGIGYARTTSGFEVKRPIYKNFYPDA